MADTSQPTERPAGAAHVTLSGKGFNRPEDFARAISGAAVVMVFRHGDIEFARLPVAATVQGEADEMRLEWSGSPADREDWVFLIETYDQHAGIVFEAEAVDRSGVYRLTAAELIKVDLDGALFAQGT